MEINFKRENSGSYMEICGEPEIDSFEMKMMCSNNITGFLPVSVRQINNKAIYMYNITGKIISVNVMQKIRFQAGIYIH